MFEEIGYFRRSYSKNVKYSFYEISFLLKMKTENKNPKMKVKTIMPISL